jgi:hypothetical protein
MLALSRWLRLRDGEAKRWQGQFDAERLVMPGLMHGVEARRVGDPAAPVSGRLGVKDLAIETRLGHADAVAAARHQSKEATFLFSPRSESVPQAQTAHQV